VRGCNSDKPGVSFEKMSSGIANLNGKCNQNGEFRENSFMVAHLFSIFNVPYTDASNMSSCNKTELDILEDGHGIPLAITKKLEENKFHVLQSSHLL
jgi:hypothetical protein